MRRLLLGLCCGIAVCGTAMADEVTIVQAARIVTMDDARPHAEAMAVDAGGRMLALVRKLAHATPGEHVTVNLFATYDEGQDGRMYTNHGCSLRRVVDGKSEEIKSEAENKRAREIEKAAREAMKAAGINDREVISKAVRNKGVEFGKEILVEVKARFKSDATVVAADDPSDASNADDAITFDASDAMPRSSAARQAMA